MEEKQELSFVESEFSTIGGEKIDYGNVLLMQINYTRFLMSQDMGQLHIFDLGYNNRDKEPVWFENLCKFINSVESLQSILVTYRDEKYNTSVKKHHKNYVDALKKAKAKAKDIISKDRSHYLTKINLKFNLIEKRRIYTNLFEECLMVAKRAGLIGGSDIIEDEV